MSYPGEMFAAPPPTSSAELDQAVSLLAMSAPRWRQVDLPARGTLLRSVINAVYAARHDWVATSCAIKRIAPDSKVASEEWATGPVATLRYLQLLARTLSDTFRLGRPRLPAPPFRGPTGKTLVPVFPTRQMYDRLLFRQFRAHAWLSADQEPHDLSAWQLDGDALVDQPAGVALVLGAGNVAAIPATDTLDQLFTHGRVVLLKFNPVLAALGPVLERAFQPLIDTNWLRIVYGGADLGQTAIDHPGVAHVHITGAYESHQRIVWGQPGDERAQRIANGTPRLTKTITSELGNVTPWLIVPGDYTRRQLSDQAQNVAAMIVNNASFNCIALKMIVTCRDWHQRNLFLDLVEEVLKRTPLRTAWYPGAVERFAKFAGYAPERDAEDRLPWTIVRDAHPAQNALLFGEESFTCVCGETALAADDATRFVDQAVDFLNEQLWGTLGAGVMVPADYLQQPQRATAFWNAIDRLRYGIVGINHWPALAYAQMTIPWGGYPGASLADPASGLGWVHNPYLLRGVEKSVLQGPLIVRPKPLWFASHRYPRELTERVAALYHRPTLGRLLATCPPALFG